MNTKNQAEKVTAFMQRIYALKAYVTPKMEITIDGERYKLAELIAVFQAGLDGRAAVAAKRAELKATIDERDGAQAKCAEIDKGIKAWVVYQFGAQSGAAHDFGFPPPKVGVKSVATKVLAVERSKATREARHTMGKKQKKSIKGKLTPIAAPAVDAARNTMN